MNCLVEHAFEEIFLSELELIHSPVLSLTMSEPQSEIHTYPEKEAFSL